MRRSDRREFLRQALHGLVGSAAFGSVFGKLFLAQNAVAGQRTLLGTDYRALVCIFLEGGNDAFNTVLPRDPATHAQYAQTRSFLAVPLGSVVPINPISGPLNGGTWGLHLDLSGVAELFEQGRAAIVANVGPLVRPTNKQLYNQRGHPLPPQLFSHSDQTVVWQTPRADTRTRLGWGGRLADIFHATNPNQVLSMNVSLAGENVFQAGEVVLPYFVSPDGVERISAIATSQPNCGPANDWRRRRCLTFRALLDLPHAHVFERAYADLTRRAMATSEQVLAALEAFPRNDPAYRPFWERASLPWNPDNLATLPSLSAQLLMIVRLIRARSMLGMVRQLFYARLGGFDTHGDQLNQHPPLLSQFSQAVRAFQEVLDNLGLAQLVTTFTASEFGRTLTVNSSGTDHGWGGHHFVFGGAVRGRRIYGRMPSLVAQNNPDDAGWGQIIPTLSVDQYAATLAKWFGLSDADRDLMFPNLIHMSGPILAIPGPDLGFLNPP
ncbi:MAG: hypothetical protein KatS3mg125_1732 [Lysobacterales bacterium]|jgi:uncharacterized protein (DUF1501 family)|nr:MAG: hypothetical protein KatS3mg125_1732 [Xanthomonadales bacterium]